MTDKERIAELEARVAKLESKEVEDWPKDGDWYWSVNNIGETDSAPYVQGINLHEWNKKIGNCFRSQEEAEKYALRLESMKLKWLPKESEEYWYWDYAGYKPRSIWGEENRYDLENYYLGRTFKTREEAEEHYNKFSDAWR